MDNALDVLAREVEILRIFSDSPATVTDFTNCTGLKFLLERQYAAQSLSPGRGSIAGARGPAVPFRKRLTQRPPHVPSADRRDVDGNTLVTLRGQGQRIGWERVGSETLARKD